MKVQSIRIAPWVLGIAAAVLAGITLAFVWPLFGVDTDAAPARPGEARMAPLSLSLAPGQELAHDLRLVLQVTADAGAPSSQARTVVTTATMLTRVGQQSDSGFELTLALGNADVRGLGSQDDAVNAALRLPVHVFIRNDGSLDTTRAFTDVPAEIRQIWAAVLSLVETVLPADARAEYWAFSAAPNEGFPVQRHMLHTRVSKAPYLLHRSVEHELASDDMPLQGVKATVRPVVSGGTVLWNRQGAWVSDCSVSEGFEILLSTAADESQSFKVSRSLSLTAVDPAGRQALLTPGWWKEKPDWLRVQTLVGSQSDQASEQAALMQVPLTQALLAASRIMEAENPGQAVQWLTRYLRLHPETLSELEARIRRGESDKYQQGLAVGAVTNLGTRESLDFLEHILTDEEAPAAARVATAIAMKHTPAPDEGVVEVLQVVSEEPKDPAIASAALLSLGALANDRSGLEPETKRDILSSLEERLNDRPPRAVSPVLGALANSGRTEAVQLINPFKHSPHANIAASAYQALGYANALPPPRELLADLRGQKHYVVSGSIAQELSRYRGLGEADIIAVGELLLEMPEHTLTRRYLVELLGAHAENSAPARDHLRRHALLETDGALKTLSASLAPAG